jgi:GNAT superfamily N-acetyltransferase
MNQALTIEPARSAEHAEALRLAFQHLPDQEQVTRVNTALQLVHKKEMDPAGILVARTTNGLAGALICTTTPGAGGLVWPPQVVAGTHEAGAIEDRLVRHASSWLREQGSKLAQTMLLPSEVQLARPLERNGFVHITSLGYLRLELADAIPKSAGGLTYQAYPADPALFQRTLLQTYEATEDCPELTGARTIDEIIEGHHVQGMHDPNRWWLARSNDGPIGVLLLARLEESASWDVSYVGLVASARRQGFGRQLMVKAMAEAKAAGAAQLTLSVDRRNRPARRLYESLGFEQFDEREVFLALWAKME